MIRNIASWQLWKFRNNFLIKGGTRAEPYPYLLSCFVNLAHQANLYRLFRVILLVHA